MAMKILFMAFFFFTSFNLKALEWSDRYLFVVGDIAVRESQIKESQEYLQVMSCSNTEGILASSFKHLQKGNPEPSSFIPLFQLMVYSSSYKIKASSKVISLYKKAIQEKKCDTDNSVNVSSELFQKFIELEIFLRSRYFPNAGRDEASSAVQNSSSGIKSLLDSLKDQIRVEVLSGK